MNNPSSTVKKRVCFFRVLIFPVLLSILFLFSLGCEKKRKKTFDQEEEDLVYFSNQNKPSDFHQAYHDYIEKCKKTNPQKEDLLIYISDEYLRLKKSFGLHPSVEDQFKKYCAGDEQYQKEHFYDAFLAPIVAEYIALPMKHNGTNWYFPNGQVYSQDYLYSKLNEKPSKYDPYNEYVLEYKRERLREGERWAMERIMDQGIYQKMGDFARTNQLFYTFVESQFKKYYTGDSIYKKEHAYDRFLDLIVGKHLGLNFGTYPKDEEIHFKKRKYSRDYIYSKLKGKERDK